jgi:hypothetical protein
MFKVRLIRLAALVAVISITAAPALAQTTHLLVIVGLAGEPEHAELFQRWAATLVDSSAKLGVDKPIYLAEKAEADPKRITGRSSKDEVVKAFDALKAAGDDAVIFIVLIGHGTFDGKVAKFNVPGPDLTPADFEPLLAGLKSKHVVFVNTASASGPFMQALAGRGRTIVTATRSGSERFATLFGGYFVDAFTDDDADADKNRRVTVLEAFAFAKREVAGAYEREGIMLTEHALLNDSGGEGIGDPSPDGKQGKTAALLSLGSTTANDPLPSDPKLRALYVERRELERRIEALKLLKGSMPADRYAGELEKLATELALKTRQLREAEKKLGADKQPEAEKE